MRAVTYLILLFVCISINCLFAKGESNQEESYIIYTQEEMQSHKKRCKKEISSNPLNIKDPSYQTKRALLTISGDDADYIPKVRGAGEIFKNAETVPYQLMHNGVKVILNSYYDVQWLTDVIYALKGHHEPQEEKCFYEILKHMPENATMIELGSYWAYYSLWFATEIKGAKNYLIEPDPKRLEIGRKNFELNNKTGFFCRGFVGVVMDTDPDIAGTEYISIDDFIEKEKISHVDILHADIQGAEYEMLTSAVNHLDQIDYFIISTHNHEQHHLPCLDFLKTKGFVILAEHTASESCSGDGLIVAKRKSVEGPEHISIRKY
jgi:hypothetical protein